MFPLNPAQDKQLERINPKGRVKGVSFLIPISNACMILGSDPGKFSTGYIPRCFYFFFSFVFLFCFVCFSKQDFFV